MQLRERKDRSQKITGSVQKITGKEYGKFKGML